MKEINLERVKKHTHGTNVGRNDWKNCKDCECEFIYGNIIGVVKIKYVKNNIVYYTYNNEDYEMNVFNFQKAKFGVMLGKKKVLHEYEIGDTVNNMTIVKKVKASESIYKSRSYIAVCNKCKNEELKKESNLKKGHGCVVCAGIIVKKGINDIATTHPHLAKYFVNKEDANKYSYFSNKTVEVVCPTCKAIKTMAIGALYQNGIRCSVCGDGVSYPNKFIYSLLSQIKVRFEHEKIFTWDKSKRYDVYVPLFDILCENHGLQHYKECSRGRSLKEEQENDRLKCELALSNGIKYYIELDCRYSKLEWIKQSIMNSELPILLNFKEEDIDWTECHKFSLESNVSIVSDKWNNSNLTTKEISDILEIPYVSTMYYIRRGVDLGICSYTKRESRYRYKAKGDNVGKQ